MKILNKYNTKLKIDEINIFENDIGIKLPKDYISFLLEFNGGKPMLNNCQVIISDVNWIYGMFNEPEWASLYNAMYTFVGRIPGWYIPIARDSGGNQYLMSLYEGNYGVIAFWKHEFELMTGDASQYFDNMTKVSDSFSEFLENLKE